MTLFRHFLPIAALTVALAQSTVLAGPAQDFERELRAVYAHYRAALFRTNTGNKEATEAALAKTADGIAALANKWPAAPPQYADDPKFKATLAAVSAIVQAAMDQSRQGKLGEAHETLEKIRDELANLRRRNGVIVFSDRMNAYHSQMEKILLSKYEGFDQRGVNELRGDVAVLAYLLDDIAANPPPDKDAAFDKALAGVSSSLEELSASIRAVDVPAIKAALKKLKPAYSRLFLNYG